MIFSTVPGSVTAGFSSEFFFSFLVSSAMGYLLPSPRRERASRKRLAMSGRAGISRNARCKSYSIRNKEHSVYDNSHSLLNRRDIRRRPFT
jgi:hypothetical protein